MKPKWMRPETSHGPGRKRQEVDMCFPVMWALHENLHASIVVRSSRDATDEVRAFFQLTIQSRRGRTWVWDFLTFAAAKTEAETILAAGKLPKADRC